jgi:thiol-disulfide isomerase/thioredoxin
MEVAVAWYSYADSRPRVLVAFSADAGVSFAAPIVVDQPVGAWAPIGRVDIAYPDDVERAAGDRQVLVSWLASEREDAPLLVRRVAADGRLGRALRLADTRAVRSAGFPRLARIGDALMVAWTDAGAPTSVEIGQIPVADIPALRQPVAPAAVPALGSRLPRVGARVPEYRARTLAGQPVSVRELGAPVLLNVWATWCEPCRGEMPELQSIHERYRERGLRVVGASVDRERSGEEIGGFAKGRGVGFEIWLDPEDRARVDLGVDMLPSTLLIAADGTVLWRYSGALHADDAALREALERAVSAGAARPSAVE